MSWDLLRRLQALPSIAAYRGRAQINPARGDGSSFRAQQSTDTPCLVGWGLSTPPRQTPPNAFLFLVSSWGTGPQKLFITGTSLNFVLPDSFFFFFFFPSICLISLNLSRFISYKGKVQTI